MNHTHTRRHTHTHTLTQRSLSGGFIAPVCTSPGIRLLDQTCRGQITSSGDHGSVLTKSFKQTQVSNTECLFQRTQYDCIPHTWCHLCLEVSLSSFTSSVWGSLGKHWHLASAECVSWRRRVFTSRTNNGCGASSHSARPEALPTSDLCSLGSTRTESCTDRLEEHDKATLLRNE